MPVDRKVVEGPDFTFCWAIGQVSSFAGASVCLCCKNAVTVEPPGIVLGPNDSTVVKSPL